MNEKQIREALAEASADVERRKRRLLGVGVAVVAPAVLGSGLLGCPMAVYGVEDCIPDWEVHVDLCNEFQQAEVTTDGACSPPDNAPGREPCRRVGVRMQNAPGGHCSITAELPDGTRETQVVQIREGGGEGECLVFDPWEVRFE